jgi:hypothetical protein
MDEKLFKVRWILAPADPEAAGVCGTTSHEGRSPAAAALAAARSISKAAPTHDGARAQLLILSVAEDTFTDEDAPNVLTGEALQAVARFADVPFDLVYRRLC